MKFLRVTSQVIPFKKQSIKTWGTDYPWRYFKGTILFDIRTNFLYPYHGILFIINDGVGEGKWITLLNYDNDFWSIPSSMLVKIYYI